LIAACEEMKKSGTRSATQCGTFRLTVPWAIIEERAVRLQEQDACLRAARAPQIKTNKPKPVGGVGRAASPRK
jgi:hypothetical protein